MTRFHGKKYTVYWPVGFICKLGNRVAKCNFLWGNIRVGVGKQVFETPLMIFQIHHETIFFGGEIVIYEMQHIPAAVIVMIVPKQAKILLIKIKRSICVLYLLMLLCITSSTITIMSSHFHLS